MSYDLQLRNSDRQVKHRSPWAAALLRIVTVGIYHLVWWYRANESSAISGVRGASTSGRTRRTPFRLSSRAG